jgi:hypothetical protein
VNNDEIANRLQTLCPILATEIREGWHETDLAASLIEVGLPEMVPLACSEVPAPWSLQYA